MIEMNCFIAVANNFIPYKGKEKAELRRARRADVTDN